MAQRLIPAWNLGLSRLDVPASARPSHPVNPVPEVVVTGTGEQLSIKLRVPSQPTQDTLVEAAAPVSAGVRCVQAYRFLSLLPGSNCILTARSKPPPVQT